MPIYVCHMYVVSEPRLLDDRVRNGEDVLGRAITLGDLAVGFSFP